MVNRLLSGHGRVILAFGSRVAMVCTATLNRRATEAVSVGMGSPPRLVHSPAKSLFSQESQTSGKLTRDLTPCPPRLFSLVKIRHQISPRAEGQRSILALLKRF